MHFNLCKSSMLAQTNGGLVRNPYCWPVLGPNERRSGQEFAGNSMQQPWIPIHEKKDIHEAMQPPFRSWKRYTSEELPFRIIQGSVHYTGAKLPLMTVRVERAIGKWEMRKSLGKWNTFEIWWTKHLLLNAATAATARGLCVPLITRRVKKLTDASTCIRCHGQNSTGKPFLPDCWMAPYANDAGVSNKICHHFFLSWISSITNRQLSRNICFF